MEGLRIGQVAKHAGVGIETIRFYERQQLLEQPPRPASGYRRYPPEAVARIRSIKRAKELGFTLTEIRDLLNLQRDDTTSSGEVRRLAEAKIADLEAKIADLERMKRALAQLTARCCGSATVRECPILEALDAGTEAWSSSDGSTGSH